ncbi:Cda4p [Homalodisca vitripennis]|nr:Cda4p [Homalodisca vitripennis]
MLKLNSCVTQTPQMILVTFDGAINLNNFQKYTHLFNDKRRNPNGCELKATFFISHEYCDYNMVQELAHYGHEIGVETVSLQQGLQDKGYEEWVGEMIGMREILRHFANISRADIVGMRAPFLKPGRNTQYEVVEDFGFIYDSSVGVPPLRTPVWPYTLDYKISHECKSGTCPTKSFPGIWEVPLNAHYVETYEGGHCPYLDQCVLHNHDKDDVFEWLQEDFYRSYKQNRAPYMLPFHTNWFQLKELEDGLHKFVEWSGQCLRPLPLLSISLPQTNLTPHLYLPRWPPTPHAHTHTHEPTQHPPHTHTKLSPCDHKYKSTLPSCNPILDIKFCNQML